MVTHNQPCVERVASAASMFRVEVFVTDSAQKRFCWVLQASSSNSSSEDGNHTRHIKDLQIKPCPVTLVTNPPRLGSTETHGHPGQETAPSPDGSPDRKIYHPGRNYYKIIP